MASTRIIVTKKRPVFMANICSKCGFPMITVVTIEAEAEKTYTFSSSKAEEIANETADNAIWEEIRRIEACGRRKTILVEKVKNSSMIGIGHFCASGIQGFNSACPLCMNYEPWKSKENANIPMENLNSENFPRVFTDATKAEDWAKEYVLQLIKNVETQREEETERKKAQVESICSYKQIKDYELQRETLPELQQKRDFLKTKAELEQQNKKVGLFDFKRKKYYSEQLRDINSKIGEIRSIIVQKQHEVDLKIIDLGVELIKLKAIGFGCTGEVCLQDIRNTFAYYMETEDIPEEMLYEATQPTIATEVGEIMQPETTIDNTLDVSVDNPVFCRRCGFKLLPESDYCSKCGSRIDG